MSRRLVLFWSGIALLVVLLGVMLLPTLNLGFVADDFFLLVPDQRVALTESVDELHRPLRNVILRMLGSHLGIRWLLPYRLLVALNFVAILILLFRLIRRLGAEPLAALAGVFVLAFFPRNEEVLYWFAAWQDLAAAAAVLAACIFFLKFRESGRTYELAAAAVAYLIALGFKETTVVLPVLLLSLDFYRERSISSWSTRSFWRAYLPFAAILLAYVVYFFFQSGAASLAGQRTGGFYGFRGVTRVFAGVMRALFNIALPFFAPFRLKNFQMWQGSILLFELGVMLILVWRLNLWPALILTASWMIWTILPTATFAVVVNADRYLFVPMLGVAVFAGLLGHALLIPSKGPKYAIPACVVLTLYTSAGISKLVIDRERSRKAGQEVAMVIRETMRQGSILPAGGEVDFVNLTGVFSNGLSEALHANGFPFSVRILRNFSAPDSDQQRLVAELSRCRGPLPDVVRSRIILMEVGGQIRKLGTGCASNLVDSDRALRPAAWELLYSGQ